jgi:uncharacterized protein YjbI with pentapeptide repeats
MPNQKHLAILRKGVKVWNQWRKENLHLEPDLSGADLVDAELPRADLRRTYLIKANLQGANLRGARISGDIVDGVHVGRTDLVQADLTGADLRKADLRRANLFQATLIGTDLRNSDLSEADLSEADLRDSKLEGADLRRAQLVNTCLKKANLNGCQVFGIATWNLDLEGAEQSDLIITPRDEPNITVDKLEVAQFVYLMLSNKNIRDVIDTITGKGVLILGRFSEERKAVLDAIKERLRGFDLVPMVFDWDKPSSRDLTETVQLLANLSRFVVADLTDAKSIPQELSHIIPFLPSVPVRPIILAGQRKYGMAEHWTGYKTMLPVFEYEDKDHLIDNIEMALIAPIKEWEAGYDNKKALEEANRAKDEEITRLRAKLAAREAV